MIFLLFCEPVQIARLKYSGGGDWYANPTSLPNFLEEFEKRTGIPVIKKEAVVSPSDKELFSYPFIYLTGHGRIDFSPQEAKNMREYFERGGFLLADDNCGLEPYFKKAIKKVFPDIPLVEVGSDHEIFHNFYQFKGLPQIHRHWPGPPVAYGIFLKGRLVVLFTYNCDLGDGWEDPEVHKDPPEKREQAFRMGVNILLYALTH